MRIARTISAALAVVMLCTASACIYSTKDLTRRYKSASESADAPDEPLVSIGMSSFTRAQKPKEATPPLLYRLGDRAQARLVREQAAGDSQAAAELVKRLTAAAGGPSKSVRFRTMDKFDKRLSFVISPSWELGDGDRIQAIEIKVTLDPEPRFQHIAGLPEYQFGELSGYEPILETIDLGTLAATESRKTNTNLSLGSFPVTGVPIPVEASSEFETNRSAEASTKIRQQRHLLTAFINGEKNELTIYRESAPGYRADGAIAVDVDVFAPEPQIMFWYSEFVGGLFDESTPAPTTSSQTQRTPKDTDDIRHRFSGIRAPQEPLRAEVTARYKIRRITSGEKTFIEGDDRIEFIEGTTEPLYVQIVGPEDLDSVSRYGLYAPESGMGADARDQWVYLRAADESVDCEFEKYEQAEELLEWIHATMPRRGPVCSPIDGYELWVMSNDGHGNTWQFPLHADVAEDLSVQRRFNWWR